MQQKSNSQAEGLFFQEPPLSTIPLLQESSFPLKTTMSQRCFESGACREVLVIFPLGFKILSFLLTPQNCLLCFFARARQYDGRGV